MFGALQYYLFCCRFINYYKVLLINYFILRLHPQIFYCCFVLICIEASSSYFILGLCLHNLFWGFVLVFYFETLSLDFSLRLPPHHCYVILLRLCSSVWGFGPRCCRLMLLLLVLHIWFVSRIWVCDSVPFVFVYRVTDANVIWFEFTILIFYLLCQLFFFSRVIR